MKRSAMIGWGVGSFTSSALVGAVGLLHLRFMTDSLGLAMQLAGFLVVVSRFYDAAIDPLMGVVSDRTRTRWGRYRPYLFGGGLAAALSMIAMFNVPGGLSGAALTAYVTFSLLLYSTAYTMFRIPYLALGRSITQDFNERSKLITYSVYGSSLGGLAATSAAPYLLATLGSDRAGHGLVALILAILIAIGGMLSFALLDNEDAGDAIKGNATTTQPHVSFREAWVALRANRPFQYLIGFKVLMFAGLAVSGAAVPYYTRYVLGASDKSLGSMFLFQMGGMMLSQLMWVRIAKRFGRRNGLMAAAMLQIASMFCWLLIPAGHPFPWIQLLTAIQGVSGGGIFFGLYTVLTDTMDQSRSDADGADRSGILAGVFVMVEKATTAAGFFIFSTVLGMAGYVSAKDAGAGSQPPSVVTGIVVAMSVLPAVFAMVACMFLQRLRLPSAPEIAPTGSARLGSKGAAAAAILLAVLTAWVPHAQARSAEAVSTVVPAKVMIKRVYTRPDGLSAMDEVELPRVSGGDGKSVGTRLYTTDVELGTSLPGTFIDWHGVTTPRLLTVLGGQMEIGLGDGSKHVLKAGDIALVMDMAGPGHTSRMIGTEPVTAMTVRLNKDDPLKAKLNSCPPNVAPAQCVANSVSVTRPDR